MGFLVQLSIFKPTVCGSPRENVIGKTCDKDSVFKACLVILFSGSQVRFWRNQTTTSIAFMSTFSLQPSTSKEAYCQNMGKCLLRR